MLVGPDDHGPDHGVPTIERLPLGAALIFLTVIGVLTIGALLSAVWRGRSRALEDSSDW